MNSNFLLWPILGVWMGLAFVVLFTIVGVIVWSSIHLFRDARGVRDTVYCPSLQRDLRVKAIPRHFFRGGLRFARLLKCERFGSGHIECDQPCLKAETFAV
jgi:hypothetical protein